MRITHALAALSCAVFGSAVAVPRQDDAVAEKEFKNIQSFKGSKASDIIPAMQFMSASLGVGCDECHTEDRASDEKRSKVTARAMIAMQRDINEKNFHGRNQVTCATCHAGHTHPVPVPPVVGVEIRPRRSQDVNPDAVLAAWGKAVGGDPAHPITGLKLFGTKLDKGQKDKVDATYAGEKFAFTTHGAKGDQKQGFNGNVIWFTTPRGVQQVPLVYASQYVRENAIFVSKDALPKVSNPTGATAKIGDRDVLVVSGTLANEPTRVSLYFDKKTGLLVRTLYGYPTILGQMVQTNDYGDYRKVAGVLLPMTITNHSTEGDTVTKFTSAKPDSTVEPSVFEPAK